MGLGAATVTALAVVGELAMVEASVAMEEAPAATEEEPAAVAAIAVDLAVDVVAAHEVDVVAAGTARGQIVLQRIHQVQWPGRGREASRL